jgi:hypothetical protein
LLRQWTSQVRKSPQTAENVKAQALAATCAFCGAVERYLRPFVHLSVVSFMAARKGGGFAMVTKFMTQAKALITFFSAISSTAITCVVHQ